VKPVDRSNLVGDTTHICGFSTSGKPFLVDDDEGSSSACVKALGAMDALTRGGEWAFRLNRSPPHTHVIILDLMMPAYG